MTFVVDASMAATWLLPDERDETCLIVLRQLKASHGIAPSIFRHELRNILLLSEKRGRITAAVATELLFELGQLPILDRGPGDDAGVMDVSRVHRLTAYDASYLALAIATGLPLATLDRALATAARASGITLLGPIAP